MKKWYVIWVVAMLLGVSQTVWGENDYTKFNGDFSIFSLGDSQEVLQDKIAFLESRGRVVRVIPNDSGIYLEYLQEPGDKKSTNLFFALTAVDNGKIIREIIVSRFFGSVEQWKAFAESSFIMVNETFGKPLRQNQNYYAELLDNNICSIAVWGMDDAFLSLGGTAEPEEGVFRFMLVFSLDLVWEETQKGN